MPSWKDHYKTSVLSAKRWDKKEHTGKIIEAAVITVENEKTNKAAERFCLTIEGLDMPLPLNKTNCLDLSKAWGEDYENWIGKKVKVSLHKVEYEGELVNGFKTTPIK